MNEGLTGLEQNFHFWVNYPFNICFLFRDDLFVAVCDDSGSVVR